MRKYLKIIGMVFQEDTQYRVNYLTSFLCVIFPLIAIVLLWRTVYYEVEVIKGYTVGMMVTYYILAAFLCDLVHPNVWLDIASDIREGTLSNYLLRPISYQWDQFCVHIGSQIVFIPVVLPVIIAFTLIFALDFQFPTAFSSLLLFLLASGLAVILMVQLTFLFSLSAFWFEESSGMTSFIDFVVPMLTGLILPLDLFPSAIYRITELLPFRYLLYFPVSIFLERITLGEVISGLVIQVVWIAAVYLMGRFVWYKGLKRYSAYGG